jgi:catechol 2,3-dioxygenase-like lactoylglutathione lyase family enzyme
MSETESENNGPLRHAREFRFVCHVADFEATVAFYREGLGLDVAGGWDRGADDRGLLFRAASGIIEVLRTHDRQLSPAEAWLLIEVDDVASLYERVRKFGLPLREELLDTAWGHRRFVVVDPNGVNVAFFSYIGPREVKDSQT